MKRTNRIVPTYTGDVSGACSALFELGGMVVIHDPSGCNSTYNTHDETRWYDHDSLIFITGFLEREAIVGSDDKLIADVVDAARELQPRFVALCNSPIPFISGMDFHAISRIIERQTGIPCFYVRTNGMHDYVVGAGNALVAFAERFVEPLPPRAGTLNILGVTPLDMGIAGDDASLRAFAQAAGFAVTSCWAMGSAADELSRAAEAQVNLVVSATGLSLAHRLRERFGTPYVVGMPTDVCKDDPLRRPWPRALAEALREAAVTGQCVWPCRDQRCAEPDAGIALVGEPVMAGSLAAALQMGSGRVSRAICPLEVPQELLAPQDALVEGEEGVEEALAKAQLVLADELYRPVVPAAARLCPLPHQALSGRNSWKDAQDPVHLDVAGLLV